MHDRGTERSAPPGRRGGDLEGDRSVGPSGSRFLDCLKILDTFRYVWLQVLTGNKLAELEYSLMPPSGYLRRDAQTIASFLSSCVHELEAENAIYARTPAEALRREIAGIDSVLTKHAKEPFALHTLILTRAFYARVLEQNPTFATDLKRLVHDVLEEVMSEITSVQVEDYSFT